MQALRTVLRTSHIIGLRGCKVGLQPAQRLTGLLFSESMQLLLNCPAVDAGLGTQLPCFRYSA
jgi:hypothetical protein